MKITVNLKYTVKIRVSPENKFKSRPEMVKLVGWECAYIAVEREYVEIMQCSFSLVKAAVIAQS